MAEHLRTRLRQMSLMPVKEIHFKAMAELAGKKNSERIDILSGAIEVLTKEKERLTNK